MTQENKELLIKDLYGRLQYRPYIDVNGIKTILKSIYWDGYQYLVNIRPFEDEGHRDGIPLFYANGKCCVKPYLRPVKSMTEDECYELSKIDNLWDGTILSMPYEFDIASSRQIDWLDAKQFDHRGLIQKKLAIEAASGMYLKNQ